MNRLLLTLSIAIFFPSLSLRAQEVDTIYYDRDWKVLEGPHFASFYRVAEKNTQPTAAKRFRDYYITGEMQGEGYFISLDPKDDSHSVFDGTCTTYYKSGKPENKRTFVNGLEQGESLLYDENGNLLLKTNFNQGQPHGLTTQYIADGLRLETEYINGQPAMDYYTVISEPGLINKIRRTDNIPIWLPLPPGSMHIEIKDREEWLYYVNDGLTVAMANSEFNNHGKYHKLEMMFTNMSFYPVEFDLLKVQATTIDKRGNKKDAPIISASEYAGRIRRSQIIDDLFWGFDDLDDEPKTDPIVTSYSGSRDQTTLSYNTSPSYLGEVATHIKASLGQNGSPKVKDVGYLDRVIIYPGETVTGYFLIKRKNARLLNITLPLASVSYPFSWLITH